MSNRIIKSMLSISVLSLMIGHVYAEDSQENSSNSQSPVQLDEIVMTAKGFEQSAKKAAASISVLTQAQINKKAYRDVTDALKDVPGVVVTGGGSSSDISIRGMGSAYTLILVDGKKVNTRAVRPNSDNSGIEQGWLPGIGAIERIEVVRGPMSGLYGSDAMGGVINIITKKTSQDWTGTVKLDSTLQEDHHSGNLYQANAYVSGALIENLLGFKANGTFSHREEDEIIGGYKKQRMRAGGATLSFTPNDLHTLDLTYQRSIQNRDGTVGKTIEDKANKNGPATNAYNDYYRTEYSLSHQGEIGAVRTSSYIQREETDNKTREMEAVNTTFNTINQFYWGDHDLSFGGSYLKEELDDQGNQLIISGQKITSLDRYSWALFLEDNWRIFEPFTLTTSIRLDEDEKFGSHWSPKIYGVWELNDEWIVKGGISTGYKTPALRATVPGWGQVTGGGLRNGVIIGNENLKPEKSVNYEMSLNWANNKNLNASLTVFNSEFKDKITEVGNCDIQVNTECVLFGEQFDFIRTRENVDKANMRGVEATLGWKVTPDLNWTANYTFTDTEQKSGQFKGKPLNEMPEHMFNTTLDWQSTDQVNMWGRYNFRSETSDYLGRTNMSQGKPAYGMIDVGINYKPTSQIQIAAGIYNVFDKEIDTATYSYVLDGRRYNLGLTYNF
ncbi:outer membrane siderophore receptor [Acinetobacter defluvii]|uniref:ligand-gated channel protein n=1 Tax=Acinetobacter defluvii TaxID=1871111 RepID=UPI0014902BF5|nr:ligand-gated channel protein [Acinetobacter defluvii]NNP71350.1 outer membrane siderophore receptor [Acinetobacter defluvii]